jgi:hypothetical protein
LRPTDTKSFWKYIGKIGVGNDRLNKIPMEVVQEDGFTTCGRNIVLNKWKNSFCDLLNKPNVTCENSMNNENIHDDNLDCEITCDEIIKAWNNMKNGKAPGVDKLLVELLKNNAAVCILHKICNMCFNSGIIPSLWSKGIITPIPKCSTSDHTNPLTYRGITLAPSAYKVYCGVINDRLSDWVDDKGMMCEEQNGLRKGRSTVDHLSTLTSIIETRKLKKISTFAAFIDFRKAYDKINRSI